MLNKINECVILSVNKNKSIILYCLEDSTSTEISLQDINSYIQYEDEYAIIMQRGLQ